MSITPEEWSSEIIVIPLDRLQARWPWLSMEACGTGGGARIDIRSDDARGAVQLHNTRVDDIWVPCASIGSSGTSTGTIACARKKALDLLAICDACDVAVAMLRGVEVHWP